MTEDIFNKSTSSRCLNLFGVFEIGLEIKFNTAKFSLPGDRLKFLLVIIA